MSHRVKPSLVARIVIVVACLGLVPGALLHAATPEKIQFKGVEGGGFIGQKADGSWVCIVGVFGDPGPCPEEMLRKATGGAAPLPVVPATDQAKAASPDTSGLHPSPPAPPVALPVTSPAAPTASAAPIPEVGSSSSSTAVARTMPLAAISSLDVRNLTAAEVATLTDSLGRRLEKVGKVQVMERSKRDRILSQKNIPQKGMCQTNECSVQNGKALDVDQMVVGSVDRVGSTWILSLRVVSVSTGDVIRSSMHSQSGDFTQVLSKAVPEIALELSGEAVPVQAAVATEAPPRRHRVWPWVLGGTVVVSGAAVAAILLTEDQSTPAAPAAPGAPSTTDFKIKW